MSLTDKKRFTVISNPEYEEKNKHAEEFKYRSYQTNPLREQLMRFTNNEGGKRFTIEDLLR